MSDATPKIDDRSAADVVAQATALARDVYLPGVWAGYADPADPAYQLLLVFGRLMEILIERLNQVPDKNFLAFLDLVGVEPSPGAPASVPVSFLPSAKAPEGGVIPAGTQVATTQTDTADAQIFETRQTIYATAAKLLAIVNLAPGRDTFSIIPPPALPLAPAAPGAAAPEWTVLSPGAAGLAGVPHVLFLGDAVLFGGKTPLDVTLTLTLSASSPPNLSSLFDAAHLTWSRFDKKLAAWVPIAGVSYPPAAAAGTVKVLLPSFANDDKTSVGGVETFWVAARLVGDFPASGPLLSLAAIEGSLAAVGAAAQAAPDAAFAGTTAIDLSRPWKPFGERPRYGDALYLASARAFAPDVANVTVSFALKPYTATDLDRIFASVVATTIVTTTMLWQYLAADGSWKNITTFVDTLTATRPPTGAVTIGRAITRDGTTTDTDDGTFFGPTTGSSTQASFNFVLPADLAPGKVHGQDGLWIRALLKSDDPYGREAFVASANPLAVVGSTLIPPVVEAASFSFTYKGTQHAMAEVMTENGLRRIHHRTQAGGPAVPLQPFVPTSDQSLPGADAPVFGDDAAIYLGFDRPFGDVFVSFYFQLRDTFPSVDEPPEQGQPRVAWEYLTAGGAWKPLDVQDETGGLTGSGTVSFQGPSDPGAARLFDADAGLPAQDLIWLRARLAAGAYDHPPVLRGIFPNTVLADNLTTFRGGLGVGSGNGETQQRVRLPKAPVLSAELWVREPEPPAQAELDTLIEELSESRSALSAAAGDRAEITVSDVLDVRTAATTTTTATATTTTTATTAAAATSGTGAATAPSREVWVRWRRVPNFLASGPRSRHYTLDALSGVLTLGDGTQGMRAPIAKDNLVVRDYATGGGAAAARAAIPLAIKELKSSLPYVEKVFNVEGAIGGSDPWTRDEIFRFGPQRIKNKGRAVSAEDFEWMVLQQFSEVARSKCLSTRAPGPNGLVFKPGAVTLVVVPKSAARVPRPSSALLRQINEFVAEQCLGNIVSDVHVLGPGFTEVTVRARVHARDPRQSSEVERRASKALEDFFHPLTGGEDGRGWTFGRDVQISEVFAVLQRVDGVDYVASAELVGAPVGATSLAIGENDLVASGSHDIEMI
jgi:hypothetical protein